MKREEKRLGFREWQWQYGKNLSDRLDEIAWRKYYFRRPASSTCQDGYKQIRQEGKDEKV